MLETIIEAVRIYSQYIRMEFGIEKCAKLIMRSGKQYLTKRIKTTKSRKNMKTLGENKMYKY